MRPMPPSVGRMVISGPVWRALQGTGIALSLSEECEICHSTLSDPKDSSELSV